MCIKFFFFGVQQMMCIKLLWGRGRCLTVRSVCTKWGSGEVDVI